MESTKKLIQACQFGDITTAKRLIRDGVDVNLGDGDYSPLHWATQEGHIEVVGLLLDNGADINSHEECGFTPLQKAVGENNPELVRYLLKRGADIDDPCKGQGTALHTSCAYGLLECTNVLLEAGADTTIKDDDGKVPIEYAEMYGHKEVAEIVKEVHNHRVNSSGYK